MNVSYDDEQRIMVVDNRTLHFSISQYTILNFLLENQEVKDDILCPAL